MRKTNTCLFTSEQIEEAINSNAVPELLERKAYAALGVIDKELRPKYREDYYSEDRYWSARNRTHDYVKEHASDLCKLSRTDFRNSVAMIFEGEYHKNRK